MDRNFSKKSETIYEDIQDLGDRTHIFRKFKDGGFETIDKSKPKQVFKHYLNGDTYSSFDSGPIESHIEHPGYTEYKFTTGFHKAHYSSNVAHIVEAREKDEVKASCTITVDPPFEDDKPSKNLSYKSIPYYEMSIRSKSNNCFTRIKSFFINLGNSIKNFFNRLFCKSKKK